MKRMQVYFKKQRVVLKFVVFEKTLVKTPRQRLRKINRILLTLTYADKWRYTRNVFGIPARIG